MNSSVYLDQENDSIRVETRAIVISLSFGLLAFLTLISNVLVLLVLHRGRNHFDEVMRILIQILAITDLMGGIPGCLLQSLHHSLKQSAPSSVICKLVPFMTVYLVLQSLYIVCLINLYRLFSVLRPLTHLRFLTPKTVRICAIIMKFAVFGFVLPLVPLKGMPLNRGLDTLCDQTLNVWHPPSDMLPKLTAAVAVTVIAFAIPLLILTYTNARLLYIACRVVRRNSNVKRSQTLSTDQSQTINLESGNSRSNQQNNRIKNKSTVLPASSGFKGLKTVIVVTGLFYISCIPFCFFATYALNNKDHSEYDVVSIFFLMSNTWWNGPIFIYTSKTFRKEAFKLRKDLKLWLQGKFIGVGHD
ncbi:galanin receptor type 2-like [Lytechinus variegatus]|uniref:galanin receptor type 2-like n=1 Tax=Lytechinus variegatus TaxID=7654 RepID=UPI001BB1AAE7|nr:galanin receptor type 2-like [Lytechinus variegatus]